MLCTLAQCKRYEPAAPWSPPADLFSEDAANSLLDAASDAARVCVVRANPPIDLGARPIRNGTLAISWSGSDWGVAWVELVDALPVVYFARVGRDGQRHGTAIRVTERGYRGSDPVMHWDGEGWMLVTSGGIGRFDELWLQRIDPRGALSGRPRKLTAGDRHDRGPSLIATAGGYLLAWAAEVQPREHHAMVMRLGPWGQQLLAPESVAQRRSRITDVCVAPLANGAAVLWTATRSSNFVVEGVRVDDRGYRRTAVTRVVEAPHPLLDRGPRVACVSNGQQITLAWESWREGVSRVNISEFAGRIPTLPEAQELQDPDGTLSAPRLIHVDPTHVAVALQRSVGEVDQSAVVVIRQQNSGQSGVRVRVRGHEATAERPVLSLGEGVLGMVTQGPRGLSFHRIPLVPCE